MPGFVLQEEPNPPLVTLQPAITSTPKHSLTSPVAMASTRIKYIFPQIDKLAGTSTQACRENPLRLLKHDLGALLSMMWYLPYMILPFRTSDRQAELYPSLTSLRDMVLQSWLCSVELTLLMLVPAALVFLPGLFFIFGVLAAFLFIYMLSWPMQGSRIVYSRMDNATVASAKGFGHERWLFVNGCATGHRGLQQDVDRLSKTFGRPVIGVHNQTYGFIADLMECLLQRCLAFKTMDVRITYDYVKACLLDPTVSKVVLIAHSQGGIVASLALDSLFTNLPLEAMSKLEVYTFGSAASHFNNPRSTHQHQSPTSESASSCIPHIEHYVNEWDLIPRWGVLYNVTHILDNRYCGRIFVRMNASGHMFIQHYMSTMFPLENAWAGTFLDQVVDADEKLATRREGVAVQQVNLMRKDSGNQTCNCEDLRRGNSYESATGAIVNGKKSCEASRLMLNSTESQAEARGKTVRQLSRLWRYVDGGDPVD